MSLVRAGQEECEVVRLTVGDRVEGERVAHVGCGRMYFEILPSESQVMSTSELWCVGGSFRR